MKKLIIYTAIIEILFSACNPKGYKLESSVHDYYKIEKKKDSLLIFHIQENEKEYCYSCILKNNEYVNPQNNEVFLSTKRNIHLSKNNQSIMPNNLNTHIYKLTPQECKLIFGKKLNKVDDIYVTKYTSKDVYTHDGKEHLLRAYYYDKNYNILKIQMPIYNIYE